METDELAIAFNAIETNRFGIRCARVIEPHAPLARIHRLAREQDIQFLSVRVPTNEISRVQALEDDGFRLMDSLVYYQAMLGATLPEPAEIAGVIIRDAAASDANAVGDVAAKAFSGFFGHFHADDRLSKTDADAVYIDWAKTSVVSSDVDLPVLVAETEGQLVGFLAAKRLDNETGDIVLNAVHPDWQGRGIYGVLLDHGLKLLLAAGCREVVTSTQLNNIAVQRAWGKRGLRMQKSFYTLHKWLDPHED